jgi:transaldolase
MSIYLDSADLDEARLAIRLGFVKGVTTNPSLLRPHATDPLRHAAEFLAAMNFSEFFYQPTGAYGNTRDEAVAAYSLDPERVILKLPATPDGVALAASLIEDQGIRVALTAAQTPNALIVAEAVGCVAVIPYVDRAMRDPRTDSDVVRALAQVRKGHTRIVAASVKNFGQFTQAFVAGADAVTAPLAVLEQVLSHPAGLEAEQAFAEEYRSDQPLAFPLPHNVGAAAATRV